MIYMYIITEKKIKHLGKVQISYKTVTQCAKYQDKKLTLNPQVS